MYVLKKLHTITNYFKVLTVIWHHISFIKIGFINKWVSLIYFEVFLNHLIVKNYELKVKGSTNILKKLSFRLGH